MNLRIFSRWSISLVLAAILVAVVSWIVSCEPASLPWPAGGPPQAGAVTPPPPLRPALDLPWPHRVIVMRSVFVPIHPLLLMAGAMVVLAVLLTGYGAWAKARGAQPPSSLAAAALVTGALALCAVLVAVVATPPDFVTTVLAIPPLFLAPVAALAPIATATELAAARLRRRCEPPSME